MQKKGTPCAVPTHGEAAGSRCRGVRPWLAAGARPRGRTRLEDEHLARLSKKRGRLRGDHAHVLVRLHDLLDARQRQVVVLEVGGALHLRRLAHPKVSQALLQSSLRRVLLRERVLLRRKRRRSGRRVRCAELSSVHCRRWVGHCASCCAAEKRCVSALQAGKRQRCRPCARAGAAETPAPIAAAARRGRRRSARGAPAVGSPCQRGETHRSRPPGRKNAPRHARARQAATRALERARRVPRGRGAPGGGSSHEFEARRFCGATRAPDARRRSGSKRTPAASHGRDGIGKAQLKLHSKHRIQAIFRQRRLHQRLAPAASTQPAMSAGRPAMASSCNLSASVGGVSTPYPRSAARRAASGRRPHSAAASARSALTRARGSGFARDSARSSSCFVTYAGTCTSAASACSHSSSSRSR